MLVAINSTVDAIDYSAVDDGDAIINISGSVLLIQRGHLFQSTQAGTFQHTSQDRPADAPPELLALPAGAGLHAEPPGSYQNVSFPYEQKMFYYTLPMALLAESVPEVSTTTIIVSVISIVVVFLIICWGCGSSSDPSSSDSSVTAPPPPSGYPRSQSAATPALLTPAPNASAQLQLQTKPRRQKYRGDGNTQAFCRELTVPDIRGANFFFHGKIMPYQQEEVFEIRMDGFMQVQNEAVLKCTMSETRGQCGILLETSMGSSVIYLMTDEAVSPKGGHPPQQDRHVALVRMNNRDLAADPLPTAVVERTNGHNNLCVRWCTPSGRPGDVFVSLLVHTNYGIDLRDKEGSLAASLKGKLGEHGRLHVAKGMDVALVVSAMIAAFKLQ
jgi:hypothetical protein